MQNAEIILKNCELPAVPMVAMKVFRLVNDLNMDIDVLQDTIMADEALAARVLRVANSAYYSSRRSVDTISDAIIMMGFQSIKNIVLAASTREVYKSFGLLEQKLWEHSIGVSVAASILSQEVPGSHAEEGAVAGLLHDVGKVIMNNSQPERFLILTEMVYNERATFSQIEKEVFGFGHAEVGALLAAKWGFPESLCETIRLHHFKHYEELKEIDSEIRRLCLIISLADALCIRLGIGYRGPMADLELNDRESREALDISDARYDELTEEFKEAYLIEKRSYQM